MYVVMQLISAPLFKYVLSSLTDFAKEKYSRNLSEIFFSQELDKYESSGYNETILNNNSVKLYSET